MLYNVITKLYNVRDTNTPVELWRGGGDFSLKLSSTNIWLSIHAEKWKLKLNNQTHFSSLFGLFQLSLDILFSKLPPALLPLFQFGQSDRRKHAPSTHRVKGLFRGSVLGGHLKSKAPTCPGHRSGDEALLAKRGYYSLFFQAFLIFSAVSLGTWFPY